MSLFDKFFNAASKLQPMVEPETSDAVPGSTAPILSGDITKKLAERHQLLMTAAREKNNAAAAAAITEDGAAGENNTNKKEHHHHEKKDKKFGNNLNQDDEENVVALESSSSSSDDDNNDEKQETSENKKVVIAGLDDDEDDELDGDENEEEEDASTSLFATTNEDDSKNKDNTTANSNWGKKGDGDSDFLVFGTAKANALKGAVNTREAVAMSEADHYMAQVSAFTYVQYPAASKGEQPSEKTFKVTSTSPNSNSYDEKFSLVEKMVSVDTCVPLWAAHRFIPRSLLHKTSEDSSTQTETRLKMQLASPTPVNKKEGAAVRNYLNGYSPIDSIALHQEIQDFYDWIRPTEGEIILRRFIETQISNIAKSLFPGCDPIVYGSVTTGLVLPYSDIDMSVLNVTNSSVEDGLLSLQKQITLNALCEGHAPQVILKTRVPLIKFTSSIAPLDVDVSINAADGQKNSEWVTKMLNKFPESRHLIVLVKYMLNQRDLNEPYRGGVGSFAATLLVLSFLQHHPIYTTDCPNRKHYGLGRLFVDFLQYYGSLGYSTERIGISLRINEMTAEHGCCFFQREGPHALHRPGMPGKGPTKMDIEDPVTNDNNAASSVRLIQMVQSTFEGAFLLLTARAPALNSVLAPAHLFPKKDQLYQPPSLLPSTDSKRFRAIFEGVDPVNDHVLKRPTLLSRILHHDVSLVEKRNSIQEAFARFQRDSISKEGQLFKEVSATVKKSKMFQQFVELKTRHRYDEQTQAKEAATSGAAFHHKIVPHSIFSLGYDQRVHEEYFKAKVGQLVEENKMTLAVLAHTQTVKNNNNSSSSASPKTNTTARKQKEEKNTNSGEVATTTTSAGQRRQRAGDEINTDTMDRKKKNLGNSNKKQVKKHHSDDSDDDETGGNFNSWQNNI